MVEPRGMFPVGVAILTMVSGILTAVSALPFLNLPYGSIRDQNFVPITGNALAFLAPGFIVVGLIIVVAGLVFLALPRLRVILLVLPCFSRHLASSQMLPQLFLSLHLRWVS